MKVDAASNCLRAASSFVIVAILRPLTTFGALSAEAKASNIPVVRHPFAFLTRAPSTRMIGLADYDARGVEVAQNLSPSRLNFFNLAK
ncbi:hypothetical protein GFM14_08695 [Rhizobium leguminosarum bv. viciae]|uniref:Uncharacterized protein n=1 Tax=Rhizobium leguminosarum bv. viciae TaxID=387 RepID=A0A7G6RHJ5_RHILV|nr:hypothetical protein [Rhizobium leguminosarum]NKJ91691.1 hypothetical protein [Rhizobium leguminosarum bv. viciae]QIO58769.1 hypothetical protein HA463_14200 [Rhizobium leguminosarum bv. trifolii]QND41727.1 hypothetical protein HB770_02625 [Rhizobium leguminosarum bv. viciae]WSH72519.1 hypothetical protein U8Q02_02970 [Rhizobium leguminosarum]